MYGAIFGDIVGSPYEFDRGEKTKLFRLFTEDSTFTDDTVMTLAIAAALLECNPDAEDDIIKNKCIDWMRRVGKAFPNAGYGGMFADWLSDDTMEAYGSFGNGSAMRVSAVGWLFPNIEKVRHIARLTAEVTHNHPEGIKGAEAVASVIFLARSGWPKAAIKGYVTKEFGYDLNRTLDSIRPDYKMNATCQGSVPEAIIAFLEAEDFEDAVRGAVSIGGDTDTLAAMAGSMAEAFYTVPDEFKEEVRERLPEALLNIFNKIQELSDRIEDRRNVSRAMAINRAEQTKESVGRVLSAIAARADAGGALYLPVTLAPEETKLVEDALGEKTAKCEPLPFDLKIKNGKDEHVLRPMPRSVQGKDGKHLAVFFSSTEELKKCEPSLFIAQPVRLALNMVTQFPGCDGLVIDPAGGAFYMSMDIVKDFLTRLNKETKE